MLDTTPLLELPEEVEATLYEVHSVLRLAVFAVEARRVLNAITEARELSPDIDKAITSTVTAPNEWQSLPDASAQVLTDIADRLGDILKKL